MTDEEREEVRQIVFAAVWKAAVEITYIVAAGLFLAAVVIKLLFAAPAAAEETVVEEGTGWTIAIPKPEDYSLDRNPFYSVVGISGEVQFWLIGGQIEVRCDEKAREISPRACAGARSVED